MALFGDLNEVKILGNITSDIELRFTGGGTAVANFGVATNRRFKQGEEWKDETDFHNIVVWANLAQNLAQRAKKGTRIMVTGRLQTRSWDGQDGKKNYKTEVIADDVFLIDRYERGKGEDLPQAKVTQGDGNPQNQSAKYSQGKQESSNSSKSNDDDIIDPNDLPF